MLNKDQVTFTIKNNTCHAAYGIYEVTVEFDHQRDLEWQLDNAFEHLEEKMFESTLYISKLGDHGVTVQKDDISITINNDNRSYKDNLKIAKNLIKRYHG